MSKDNAKRSPRDQRKAHPPRMRLTGRDYAVLHDIHRYRYLSTQQIQHLHFPSMSTAYDRMAKLYHQSLVERIFLGVHSDKMNRPMLYVLTRRGAELLARHLDSDIDWQKSQQNVGDTFLEHNMAMNDVRIVFTLACKQSQNQLLYWMSEFALRASYDRVPLLTASAKRKTVALIPDSYCFLKALDGERHLFFEVDMGTMELKRFKNKVRAYRSYRDSKALKERFSTRIFDVLTVTPSERRLHNLRSATAKVGAAKRFYFTTLDALTPTTVFDAPIWYTAQQNDPIQLFR